MPSSKIGPPVAPPVLANVPPAVIRHLDVSELLINTVVALKPPENIAPTIAFNFVESYLKSAKLQQRRIERARAAILKGIVSRRHVRSNLFNEVHFYLICWARIAKLSRFIADKTKFRRVGLVIRRYDVELKNRIVFRDHLEHFEERLPGGAKQNRLLVPGDLFNIMDDNVTFGGCKCDISPTSIQLLQAIVTELRTAIVFDAVEALSIADADLLSFLIERTSSSTKMEKFTKAIQSNWKHKTRQGGP